MMRLFLSLLFLLPLFTACGELELPEEEETTTPAPDNDGATGEDNNANTGDADEDGGNDVPSEDDKDDIGEARGEGTYNNPYSVRNFVEVSEIAPFTHVKGFVVGCIEGTTLSSATFGLPGRATYNLLIADSLNERTPANCIPMKLTNYEGASHTETFRSLLNLFDHPEVLGRQILIRTPRRETYFGLPGIKAPADFELLDE